MRNYSRRKRQRKGEQTTFSLIRVRRHARPLICINRHMLLLICINRHAPPLICINRHAPAFGFTARLLFKITSAVQHPLYKGLHKTLLYTKKPDLQGFCEACIFFHIFPYTRKTFQNQGFSTHCIMYKKFSKPFIHIFSLPTTVNRR